MNLAATSIPYPTNEELDSFLDIAIRASKKAGDIILGYDGGAEVTKVKANSRDLLTLVDPLCEKTIRDTVLESFPDHKFLGEEDVPAGAEASAAALSSILSDSQSPYLWIVDPIDGTSNCEFLFASIIDTDTFFSNMIYFLHSNSCPWVRWICLIVCAFLHCFKHYNLT